MNAPEKKKTGHKNVGIDDFAKKKGHDYGSVIVDHDTREVIDLIDSRDSEDVEAWFAENGKDTQSATRDRGKCFIKALNQFPHISQISDKFHLIKNIVDITMGYGYYHYRKFLKDNKINASERLCQKMDVKFSNTDIVQMIIASLDQSGSKADQKRIAKWNLVHALMDKYKDFYAVSKNCDINPTKIKKLLNTPKECYYNEACREIYNYRTQIADAIIHSGTYKIKSVYSCFCNELKTMFTEKKLMHFLKPVLIKLRTNISKQKKNMERDDLYGYFFRLDYEIKIPSVKKFFDNFDLQHDWSELRNICTRFCNTIMNRENNCKLDDWIRLSKTSSFEFMRSFGEGIEKEFKSVNMAIKSKLNNGLLEGTVNLIKLVKRAMFGRASFPLLRKMVLAVS